jgi:hypothetical protein
LSDTFIQLLYPLQVIPRAKRRLARGTYFGLFREIYKFVPYKRGCTFLLLATQLFRRESDAPPGVTLRLKIIPCTAADRVRLLDQIAAGA